MPSIHLRGVSFAHTTTPVLSDVDLHLDVDRTAHGSSWVGVVGANGQGKSTLLELVAARLVPTRGRVDVHAELPPLLLRQHVDEPSPAVAALGRRWDAAAMRWRARLDLDVADLLDGEWHTRSPGVRMRWELAAALASDADVLLLDEPTNHLDGDGTALVLGALHRFTGLGLVVSHDRTVLEELTTRTLRVHDGGVTLHAGAYGAASTRWRSASSARREHAGRAARQARREAARLGELRRARHGAEASARRDRRMAGPRDSDAREVGRKVAAAAAERAIAARVATQRGRAERAAAAAVTAAVRRDHRGEVAFHDDRVAGDAGGIVAAVDGDVRHDGGGTLLRDVRVTLVAGDRVHVAGGNGAGKTTLLAALLGDLRRRDAFRAEPLVVARLEQLDAVAGMPGWLDGLDPTTRGRVLGTAARLGVVPAAVLAARAVSPGERRKLELARLLVEPADVLLLDEPTNHLDLPAVEALQTALQAWSGTLLLVTHDATLAAAATDAAWQIEDGHVLA